MTILDAIAVGGGLRDFAKGSHIYVLRTNADKSQQKLLFDYKQVIKGKKLAENVELRPGDTIVIPSVLGSCHMFKTLFATVVLCGSCLVAQEPLIPSQLGTAPLTNEAVRSNVLDTEVRSLDRLM